MEQGRDLTPELPPPIDAGPSPLVPEHLVDLYLRPTKFFSSQLALGKTPYVVLVTLALGISAAQDRIDTRLMRADPSDATGQAAIEALIGTWPTFWAVMLVLGAIGGVVQWWVGGWWCRVRISWSGAPSPDPRLARLLLVYSSFVYAAPSVAVLVVYTFLYPSYPVAFEQDMLLSLIVLLFVFWSLVTTYRGAEALFPVKPARARLWFLILPGAFYLITLASVGALFALATEAP